MTSDVVVVGGGICGLWTAKYAADAGMSVTLIDKKTCGSGGSNGVLGALAPHLPDSSNEKKRFHWRALDELPELVAQLEEATGLSTGYGQTGRLMPLRVEGFARRMQRCSNRAPEFWQGAGLGYRFDLIGPGEFADWVNPEFAPLGLAHDTMSGRAAPRLITAALKASLKGRVEIIEGFSFGRFDEEREQVVSAGGEQAINCKHLVLAAGHETYDLLKPLASADLGHGVKGHSALLRLAGVADMPSLYDNGVYVVPHKDGTVAVGSSSQNKWTGEHEVDKDQCAGFIERAMQLCPRLQEAELVEYWAGVRPRSFAGDPIVGRLAKDRNIFILSGGFKISFGIAHRLARGLVQRITGGSDPLALPRSYEVGYHLKEARRDGQEIL